MGSKDRSVKDKQLEKVVATFEAYKTQLTEKGLDAKTIGRDPRFRELKAEVKKARGRVKAIEAAEAHVQEVAAKDTKVKVDKSAANAKGQGGGKKQPKAAADPAAGKKKK